ncbi:DUF4340 domain-containing protein [Wenzhouxiangella sp. AB-CW3]|uniref:DUF4340 domain-containing protein n=1 Tax=Wenzhouxiangella sp. AB-CW3 TaxID=2771012 RepID=UPI00168B5E72|nr:DUF4340 domain-containing protein [Wenzhouxiangella sp. AB-CW3]QOC21309.1 DUF4340 domain-containing protein [Wenzhouxiangella sp. AB-CW3]
MKPGSVVVLGVIALALLTLALMMGRGPQPVEVEDDRALLPDLRTQVNEIDALEIIGPDGEYVARLHRDAEHWRVRERDGFRADFALIQSLLRDLLEARRVDERTSNPEWYPRLGVADPGEGGEGVLIRFPGTGLPDVIIGIQDQSGTGRFARLGNEDRSWLIDRDPEVPADLRDWLERAVMDIPASELAEITLRHDDGDTVRLRSTDTEDRRWVLLNVPEDQEVRPEWYVSEPATSLTAFEFEDVRRHESLPDGATRALFRTVDGLNFLASLFEDESGQWVHFSVSAETAALEPDEADDEATELAVDAAAVDARLSGWQFAIDADRYGRMTRRLEDFLMAKEEVH